MAWTSKANLRGPQGIPGDPLSPAATAAAESAAEAKVDLINPVRRADAGAPVAAPDIADYLEVSIDNNGRLGEGTFYDGTKHLPQARVDSLGLGAEQTSTANTVHGGFVEAVVDQAGRLLEGLREDGTRYVSVLSVDSISVAGVRQANPVLIVVPIGQSNALWKWYSASTVKVREENPHVMVWDAAKRTASVVPTSHGESLGLNFSLELSRLNPGAKILAVPTAVGSSGFTPGPNGTWDPASVATPNLYAAAVAAVKDAVAATGGTVVAALWSQGENDRSTMTEAQYDAALDNLIAQFRADIGVADLPFLIGSMTPEEIAANPTGTAGIAAAHVDTPRRVQRTAYVGGPKDQILFGERIHYSPEGNAIRGRLFATEGLYRARLNVAGKNPIQPQGLTISRSGDTAELRWQAPPCRFTAFLLETSVDSGATWVPQTLTGPVALSHTMTAAAGAPLWARISTTNETGTTTPTLEVRA